MDPSTRKKKKKKIRSDEERLLYEKVDWRERGFSPRAKDQRQRPYCFMLASSVVVSAVYYIKTQKAEKKPYYDLSEQQIIDSFPVIRETGISRGEMVNHMQQYCLTTNFNYPRKIINENYVKQVFQRDKVKAPYVIITNFEEIIREPEKTMEDVMKEKVRIHPILGCIAADDLYMKIYKDGVYCCPNLCKPNHFVVIVGFGTEPKDKRTQKEPVRYWIILNSWGAKWGNQGYMKLERGVNMCGIEKYAWFPVIQ